MRRFLFVFWLALLTTTRWAATSQAQDLTLVNTSADKTPALTAATKEAGLVIRGGDAKAKTFAGAVVVWEARASADITPETTQALSDYVRQGGSLLLSLSQTPGTGPFRLSAIFPTTAWHTQSGQSLEAMQRSGSIAVAETDAKFFAGANIQGLSFPFAFPLRPFHAVERGEGRYERFARSIPYINLPVTADNTFWTRPLLNRDWQIRVRGDDVAQTPLLLTGRYGAGRVGVFGSSLEGMADTPSTRAFLTPTLQWLAKKDETANAPLPANFPAPVVTVDKATGALRVTLKNPLANALSLQVLARVSTWERAIIGDVTQTTTLPPNGQATVDLPLPKDGPTSYQALDYQDAFDVRLGILSADGATLLNESRHAVDLSPSVGISVRTDNVRTSPYPFKAPGPEILNFPNRMGAEINDYAYPPGQAVNAQITLRNGTHNIAPLAAVRDETKPDNPTVSALNDEASHGEQRPNTDNVAAYGTWEGVQGKENTLSFSFPAPVTVSGVTLIGSPDNYRNYLSHNPEAVIIELDGKEVIRADGLDQRFIDELGQIEINFAPQQGRVLKVRLPWVEKVTGLSRNRVAPWLGDIRIEGTTEVLPPMVQGNVALVLRDSLSGATTPVGTKAITVEPGTVQKLRFTVTPPNTGAAPRFYTLEASFAGQQGQAPFIVIQPTRPLQALASLKPPSAPDLGFIVTRGFRNVITTGTGTDEIPPGWATPDDLIWAYSRQMKQLGANSRTQANRLYLSESDMRHYSTPWRNFPDGVNFYDIAPALLVERMKRDSRWKDSDRAILSHSDRWDSAPDVDALNGWQDFIGFDDYLRAQKLPGLQGRTRLELANEIHTKHESRWQAWHLERYINSVHNLRSAFAKEGKDLIITAQGSPLVPAKFEKDLTATIRGQSDDSTWGMVEENVPLSVGRQMGILAFNPGWAMSTLIQWGWDSAVLENQHWHNPVGTTEPSRRHMFDRAWRGTIGWDGQYKSIHTYGYNSNGGVSFTMTPNDWQQWWRVEERHSLIAPEAPLGAGLIISTARFADPDHTAWSGSGGWGKSAADDQVRTVARAVRGLQEAGLSVPFAANVGTLANWKGDSSLVLLDLSHFSAEEVASLAKLKARGVRLVAFKGTAPLSAAAATLFGVTPDGYPAIGQRVGDLNGQALVASTNTLLIPVAADAVSVPAMRTLAPLLKKSLNAPITFPLGTAGYGFVSQGKKFIVLEDWREEGRTVSLHLRADAQAKSAQAVDVNSHRTLAVRRDGPDWVVETPLRPGDGVLIAVNEVLP